MSNPLSKYRTIPQGNSLFAFQNIVIDGEEIDIPKNVPTFIIGSKNAGKSTIISTLIAAEKMNNVYSRIIYVYTDHVDSTLAETCHETLIRVPVHHAEQFIINFFKIKTEYLCWVHFLSKNYEAGLLTNDFKLAHDKVTLDSLLRVYTDNVTDAFVRNSLNINKLNSEAVSVNVYNQMCPLSATVQSPDIKIRAINKLLNHAVEYIAKYSKRFDFTIDGTTYYIDGLAYNQYDQLIIDDVGVAAPYLFPTRACRSVLYRYLTASRHILLGTIIAGQDLLQLPKYVRKEINTFLFGVGIDIETVKTTQIPSNIQHEIINEYPGLKQYDFLLYNGINNAVKYFSLN